MDDMRTVERLLACEGPPEVLERPRDVDSLKVQSRVPRELEGQCHSRHADPQESTVVTHLARVALPVDVTNAPDLEVGDSIPIHVQHKLENLLRISPDDNGPLAAHLDP